MQWRDWYLEGLEHKTRFNNGTRSPGPFSIDSDEDEDEKEDEEVDEEVEEFSVCTIFESKSSREQQIRGCFMRLDVEDRNYIGMRDIHQLALMRRTLGFATGPVISLLPDSSPHNPMFYSHTMTRILMIYFLNDFSGTQQRVWLQRKWAWEKTGKFIWTVS